MREQERERRLKARFLTQAGNAVQVPVGLGLGSVAITFPRTEPDTNYGVVATANWVTALGVTARTTAGCTVTFAVVAPANATVDVVTFRGE